MPGEPQTIVSDEMYLSVLLQIAGVTCFVAGEVVNVHRPDLIHARCANETDPPYPFEYGGHHTHGPLSTAEAPIAFGSGGPLLPTSSVGNGISILPVNSSTARPLGFSTSGPAISAPSAGPGVPLLNSTAGPVIIATNPPVSFSILTLPTATTVPTQNHSLGYYPSDSGSTRQTAGPTAIGSVTSGATGGSSGSSAAPLGNSGTSTPSVNSTADATPGVSFTLSGTTAGSSESSGGPLSFPGTYTPPYANLSTDGPIVGQSSTQSVFPLPTIIDTFTPPNSSTGGPLSASFSSTAANSTAVLYITTTITIGGSTGGPLSATSTSLAPVDNSTVVGPIATSSLVTSVSGSTSDSFTLSSSTSSSSAGPVSPTSSSIAASSTAVLFITTTITIGGSTGGPLSASSISLVPADNSTVVGPIATSSLVTSVSGSTSDSSTLSSSNFNSSASPTSSSIPVSSTAVLFVTTTITIGGSTGGPLSASSTFLAPADNSTVAGPIATSSLVTSVSDSTSDSFTLSSSTSNSSAGPVSPTSSSIAASSTAVLFITTTITIGGSIGDPLGASSTSLTLIDNSSVVGPIATQSLTSSVSISTSDSFTLSSSVSSSTAAPLAPTSSSNAVNGTIIIVITETVSGVNTLAPTISSTVGPLPVDSSATSLTSSSLVCSAGTYDVNHCFCFQY
ncbi:hypothetical protein MMC24_003469 [Lignoscripta atroalba]|nr:hypothetical protein [Lignoscripta atroalba]